MLMKVAFRNLFRNPRRSFITGLTVAVGACALFLFDGFNTGIMNQYRDNTVHGKFGHGQVNTKGYRGQPWEKPWERWIAGDQVVHDLASVPGVTAVFPRIEFYALIAKNDLTTAGRGVGVDGPEEKKFFTTINVVEGDNLGAVEDGIVLGLGLARAIGAKVDDTVTVLANTISGSINAMDFRVVGIFHLGLKDVDDTYFRVPVKRTQELLRTDRVESVALGLESYDVWDGVASEITRRHPDLEATPFQVLDEVYYQHSVDWLGAQFGVIRLIVLFVVLLGIFNTASSAILERTREIGNLRANGESTGDVLKMLAWEGIGIGVIGAFAGVAWAVLMNVTFLRHGILMPPAPGITRQYHVLVELQPMMGLLALMLGSLTALVATVLAGVKVSRMPIAAALRSV